MTTTDALPFMQSKATNDPAQGARTSFGDEPDPHRAAQRAVLAALGASHIEVRSAWNTNITDGFPILASHIADFQVKDARASDGTLAPSGHGDGELTEATRRRRDTALSRFVSLETQFTDQNELGRFSGLTGQGRAVRAFRTITDQAGITLQ